jgi:flagellar FliJ protein
MKKSQRMKTVNSLAERQESEQAAVFSKSQRAFDVQQQKLNELQQYYREYADASQPYNGIQLDLNRLQETRQFMSKLAQAVQQQGEAVKKAEKVVNDERQRWLGSRCRTMSLGKLTDRYREQETQQVNKEEQRQADDLSSQRFVWAAQQATF